jgi:DMSO reductase family type II enzyme chaperone
MSAPTNMPTQSETAHARSFLWRFLGAAFTFPDQNVLSWLQDGETYRLLERAQTELSPSLREPLHNLILRLLAPRTLDEVQEAFLNTFGHTVRGDCPPHEIEYGELKADPLFMPHRLADIAAFYAAFGMELAPDADDRLDHIAMECEFFSVLCAKEAAALAEGSEEQREIVRQAQKQFLREHLGRWTPAFSRRLERLADDRFFPALAAFLRACVHMECARAGIPAGNDDLRLRPAAEPVDPCGQCGLAGLQTADAAEK